MYDCNFLFDCAFREGVCIVGSLLSRLDLGHMLRTKSNRKTPPNMISFILSFENKK